MLKSAKDLKAGGIERHGQFISITADPHLHFYHIKRHPASPAGHAWTTRPTLRGARKVATIWRHDERKAKGAGCSKPTTLPMGSGHDIPGTT